MRISGITYVSRKTNRIGFIFKLMFIIALLALIVVASISAYIAWNLIHPPKSSIEAFSSNIVPEYKNISFDSIDGDVSLSGWLFEVKGSGKIVILAHGYGKNRLQFSESSVDMIKSFISKGYNVLSFDLRNSGKSDGKISSFGLYEKKDLLGAIEYVKSKGFKDIVLMGFSTGASACILAGAESTDVDAVIADSAYISLDTYLDRKLAELNKLPSIPFKFTIKQFIEILANMDIEQASPINAITGDNPYAIMLIHSTEDDVIPVNDSVNLYSACSKLSGKTVELWQTGAKGHAKSYMESPQEYMERVFNFLKKVYEKG